MVKRLIWLRTEKYSRKVYSNTIVQKFRVSFFSCLESMKLTGKGQDKYF